MSRSQARMRTCSFLTTFSRFAVAARRAENARARAHRRLFWHLFLFPFCTGAPVKSRARMRTSGFLGTSSSCSLLRRAAVKSRARARVRTSGFFGSLFVYCLHRCPGGALRLAQIGPRRARLAQIGPRRLRLGQIGSRLVPGAPDWSRLVQIGPKRARLARIGHRRSRLVSEGRDLF